MPFLYFIFFPPQIKSEAKNPGPRVQVDSSRFLGQQAVLRDLVFQHSPLTYFIFFDKCNRLNNRATQNHFIYSKALPRGSLLDCFKDLPAGDGPSVVVEGQPNRLQANPLQSPILQRAQGI